MSDRAQSYLLYITYMHIGIGKTLLSPHIILLACSAYETWSAKYTVLVIQLFLTNCVQAHDNNLEVLRHIILYLSTRRPQITGHPGHDGTRFFEIPYFQEFCLSRPRIFFPKIDDKSFKKNSRGCAPHPLLTGLRLSHPPR